MEVSWKIRPWRWDLLVSTLVDVEVMLVSKWVMEVHQVRTSLYLFTGQVFTCLGADGSFIVNSSIAAFSFFWAPQTAGRVSQVGNISNSWKSRHFQVPNYSYFKLASFNAETDVLPSPAVPTTAPVTWRLLCSIATHLPSIWNKVFPPPSPLLLSPSLHYHGDPSEISHLAARRFLLTVNIKYKNYSFLVGPAKSGHAAQGHHWTWEPAHCLCN